MKQLSDGHAAIIEAAHKGHLFAYAASHLTGTTWRLSIVRDGESGHYPVSGSYYFMSETEAHAEANRLNRERLRLPRDHAESIIAQSMRTR